MNRSQGYCDSRHTAENCSHTLHFESLLFSFIRLSQAIAMLVELYVARIVLGETESLDITAALLVCHLVFGINREWYASCYGN